MKLQVTVKDEVNKTIHTDSKTIRMVSDVTSELLRILDKAPDTVLDWKSLEIKIIRD